MTRKQWESAVAWTNNVHGNSQTYLAEVDAIRSLRLEIERKLEDTDGDVDMETIHWIWDSYARLCNGGKRYQRFRQQMIDDIANGNVNWGIPIP